MRKEGVSIAKRGGRDEKGYAGTNYKKARVKRAFFA
jgi:hypothetical protein